MIRLALFLAVFLSVLPATAAGPGPIADKPATGQCVEDTEFMRREHMTLLKHQRDATMRQGIRENRHSLKGCVTCHAVAGGDGKPVDIGSPRHFCNSCHEYVAVRPDCFECHAARPEEGGR